MNEAYLFRPFVMRGDNLRLGMQGYGCCASLCFDLIAGARTIRKNENEFALFHERNHLLDGRGGRPVTIDREPTATPDEPTDDRVLEEFLFGHLMQSMWHGGVPHPQRICPAYVIAYHDFSFLTVQVLNATHRDLS